MICMLLSCVICSLCGGNFVSLGQHQWRCKENIKDHNTTGHSNHATSHGINVEPVISTPTTSVSKKSGIKCCCGKICKGARGIKMHQRSCQVILGLNNELLRDMFDQEERCSDIYTDNQDDISNSPVQSDDNENAQYPQLKKGINLPKTNSECQTAN